MTYLEYANVLGTRVRHIQAIQASQANGKKKERKETFTAPGCARVVSETLTGSGSSSRCHVMTTSTALRSIHTSCHLVVFLPEIPRAHCCKFGLPCCVSRYHKIISEKKYNSRLESTFVRRNSRRLAYITVSCWTKCRLTSRTSTTIHNLSVGK